MSKTNKKDDDAIYDSEEEAESGMVNFTETKLEKPDGPIATSNTDPSFFDIV